MSVALRSRDGSLMRLDLDSWRAPATASERALLAEAAGPVLDIGCGPGRLVVALAEQGKAGLGVDASPVAAAEAADRGAAVLCRSVFDRLPGEGRWATLLLFDGNIGIGGAPVRLLQRVRALMRPDGVALVETAPPGTTTVCHEVRVETPDDSGPWFPWAHVSADSIGALAGEAGLVVHGWHHPDGRWIAKVGTAPVTDRR